MFRDEGFVDRAGQMPGSSCLAIQSQHLALDAAQGHPVAPIDIDHSAHGTMQTLWFQMQGLKAHHVLYASRAAKARGRNGKCHDLRGVPTRSRDMVFASFCASLLLTGAQIFLAGIAHVLGRLPGPIPQSEG